MLPRRLLTCLARFVLAWFVLHIGAGIAAPVVNPQITDTVVNPQITDAVSAESTGGAFDLSDEQIDRIAKRVVQMMSEQVVRNIAWEVIPDLAEMVVKERIRQLEAE